MSNTVVNTPGAAAKAGLREFYNSITQRLEKSGVGEARCFLNYGYVSLGEGDEAQFEVGLEVPNRHSVRLIYELIGTTDLRGCRVLDVGCGRGGAVALLADRFDSVVTGVDLAPDAIAFCRRVHRRHNVRFEVGDAEHLAIDDRDFDAVINVESSHAYPNMRGFLEEVRRVLKKNGIFLYTDLLPVQRWAEVRVLLGSLRFELFDDRAITPNVLASCDAVAAARVRAFSGVDSSWINNFLAVPGSDVYERMRSGAWEYRILRAKRA
jgi:phthiocerol/phenolphthiocerol synthesis type-I polyketide synthase E